MSRRKPMTSNHARLVTRQLLGDKGLATHLRGRHNPAGWLTAAKMQQLLQEYYQARGCDEVGQPPPLWWELQEIKPERTAA